MPLAFLRDATTMEDFTAFVSWPSAPLTDRLVRSALETLAPQPTVVTALNPELIASPGRLLQWATYDALDHDLTFSHNPDSKVLSSSYVIRKALIRKHYLSRCIHNYLTKHPDSVLAWGAPRSWELDLSFADELDELWGDDLYDLSDDIEKGDPSKWWILKPGMADRGQGLRLFHTKEELQAIFEEFEQEDSDEDGEEGDCGHGDTAVVTSQLRHFVIQVLDDSFRGSPVTCLYPLQEYLGNPLLLDPAEVPLNGSQAPSLQELRGHKVSSLLLSRPCHDVQLPSSFTSVCTVWLLAPSKSTSMTGSWRSFLRSRTSHHRSKNMAAKPARWTWPLI